MPQTARSVHFYIRKGGYCPGFALHTTAVFSVVQSQVAAIIPEIVALIPDAATLSYWEWQEANGTVIDTFDISEPGTYANYFASMQDCTYIRWQSVGSQNDSSCFIHPRPVDAYQDGVPRLTWGTLLSAFISQVVAANFTDSEGFAITGAFGSRPSRRRRIRVAP